MRPTSKPISFVGFHARGEEHPDLESCDFILTEGKHFMSKLIRFGQWLRFYGDNAKYTKINHFAWSLGGYDLSEALLRGVSHTDLSRYDDFNYIYVRVNTSEFNKEYTEKFIRNVLESKRSYGVLTIANIFLTYLTGWGWIAPSENTSICSGYGAEGMVGLRRDIIFSTFLYAVSPALILQYCVEEVDGVPRNTYRVHPRVKEWLYAG